MSLQHEDYYGQIVLSHKSLRKFLFLPPYCQKNLDRRCISEKQLLPQIITYQVFVKTPFCILFFFGMSLTTHLANILIFLWIVFLPFEDVLDPYLFLLGCIWLILPVFEISHVHIPCMYISFLCHFNCSARQNNHDQKEEYFPSRT